MRWRRIRRFIAAVTLGSAAPLAAQTTFDHADFSARLPAAGAGRTMLERGDFTVHWTDYDWTLNATTAWRR